MFYRELAAKFNELDALSNIVRNLQYTDQPIKELGDEYFLMKEVQRIERATVRGTLFFGNQASIYLNFHITLINEITIAVIESKKELTGKIYLNEIEQYKLKCFEEIYSYLDRLNFFYNNSEFSKQSK